MPIRPLSQTPMAAQAARSQSEESTPLLPSPTPTSPGSASNAEYSPAAIRDFRDQAAKGRFNLIARLGRQSEGSRFHLKGFNAAERRHLEGLSESEQLFVMEHHAQLRLLNFTPLDMLSLAVQPPESRDFVLESGHLLGSFTPSQMNSCSMLSREQRNFIAHNHGQMFQMGWQPHRMLLLASGPEEHLRFFSRYWHVFREISLQPEEMLLFARTPVNTRTLLMQNYGALRSRTMSNHEWLRIATFDEQQCNRLIRELSSIEPRRSTENFLDEISNTSGSASWPERMNWLDETSHDSLRRWSLYAQPSISVTIDKASNFCKDVMPASFVERLRKDPSAQPLGTLIAGLAFTADHQRDAGQTVQRAKSVVEYLERKKNPKLWKDCETEARDAVEHCGDRVDYGFSRVEQLIERYKMVAGELPPAKILQGVIRHFNQQQVEIAAQKIAMEKGVEGENIEVYLSLASQLAQKGIDLGELPGKGLYVHFQLYKVEADSVDQVKKQLDAHHKNRSPEFLGAFENDLAAEGALRVMFAHDYQKMSDERSRIEDESSDILLDPASSDAQRHSARTRLEKIGTKEKTWYRRKALESLAALS